MALAITPSGVKKPPARQPKAPSRKEISDRAREFSRAKRHSVRVRVLKVLLPALAVGVLSLYALPSLFRVSIDKGRGTASVRAIALEAGSLKMLEPRVQGVNERNEAYEFVADSATQPAKNAETMYLDRVRGRVLGADGKITTLTAPDAVHNTKADEMTFNNGVVVKQEPDMTATFQTATAFMKQQLVVSKTPVIVRLHESTIHSEAMTLYWGDQRIVFEGNVRTHLERQPAGPDAGKPLEAERPAGEWRPALAAPQ